MNKKLFVLFAVAILIALTACGSTVSTPATTTPTPTPDVDPTDANDAPFEYWTKSAFNWVPFPVYDNLATKADPVWICTIWIGKVDFRGPIMGARENIYEVKQGECYGESHFTKKR
jgi:hypothetical protein